MQVRQAFFPQDAITSTQKVVDQITRKNDPLLIN